MRLDDSRRLTGGNLFFDGQGAVIEVAADDAPAAAAAWRAQVTRVLAALTWPIELYERFYPGGVSLAFAAPLDCLYAATEVNEWAFAAAAQVVSGAPAPDLDAALPGLQRAVDEERDPKLLALAERAHASGVNFCGDDEWTTVGMGAGGRTWPTPELPRAEDVDWSAVRDVPCALVTGTNGKTTTVRLLVSIVKAANLVPGASSTDWIQVGDELLDRDDWSGPGGARAVLKDARVEVALLETARGGLLRRGLAIPRADVAVVLNVAADHLGEMGIHSVADLTEVKFVVRRAGRRLVLNADDPEVRRRGASVREPVTWVARERATLAEHLAAGGRGAWVADGQLVLGTAAEAQPLVALDDVPITLGGAARYNVTNALCAAATAWELGLDPEAIARGLRGFRSDPESNPGRLNDFEFGGVRALVDFAHNPHGFEAVFDLARNLAPERLLVLVGQAGDRDDTSIVDLARITAEARPDLVVVKQMAEHLRGRAAGEVVELIDGALREHGLAPEAIEHAPSELAAVRRALEWARPGDLLLLLSHAERAKVLALLSELRRRGWRPGDPLPD